MFVPNLSRDAGSWLATGLALRCGGAVYRLMILGVYFTWQLVQSSATI